MLHRPTCLLKLCHSSRVAILLLCFVLFLRLEGISATPQGQQLPLAQSCYQLTDSLYLRGSVRGESGQPLAYTRLRLARLRVTTVTDSAGEFSISISMPKALRTSEDALTIVDGPCQGNAMPIHLFAPGPITFTILPPLAGSMIECTAEDIFGKERAAELRKTRVRSQEKKSRAATRWQRFTNFSNKRR